MVGVVHEKFCSCIPPGRWLRIWLASCSLRASVTTRFCATATGLCLECPRRMFARRSDGFLAMGFWSCKVPAAPFALSGRLIPLMSFGAACDEPQGLGVAVPGRRVVIEPLATGADLTGFEWRRGYGS